jgi:predicted RNase H-like HicB family nuclease
MATYIALIRKGRGTDFGVDFPDFPGCITAGRTLDEAVAMAREALALHIRGMAEDGDAIPDPGNLETIMADPENADGVAVLIDVPASRPVIERVNITLDRRLLQAIDARVASEGTTRSGFIATAAKHALRSEPSAPVAGRGEESGMAESAARYRPPPSAAGKRNKPRRQR